MLQYILANTQSPAFFIFFPDQHFPLPVTPSTLLCALGLSGTTPRPLLSSPSPGHHVTSTSGISFLGHLVHTHCSTLGCPCDKPSHRQAIHCGLVGLALALGGFLISLQHFFHTPNSFQLPLKTTLHAAHPHTCISTPVPEGVLCTIRMSVWSAVFGFTQPTPCTPCQFMKSPHMHTGLPATLPWLVHHYVPTIHLPSTSSNILHCTCTCAPTPSPAALPHLDVPVQPCFPLPGGIFTTNQP